MILDKINYFDKLISDYFFSNSNSIIYFILEMITHLADTATMIIFIGLILFYLYKKKEFVKFKFFSFIVILSTSIFSILKLVFQRLRPDEGLVYHLTYSFPSGHTTMATVFGSGVYFLFKDKIKSKINKNIFLISVILFSFLVGVSRIYLNVHWTSDVVFGWALGLCVVWHFRKKLKNN